jgi:hypothetical protein
VFDPHESVTYREFDLNDGDRNAPAGPLVGCILESIDWTSVRGVGYTEKRARGDGNDAGLDVWLGPRRFPMRGTIYGATRGDTFDRLTDLIAALTPTLAFDDDDENMGFLPLAFSQPTDRTDDWPDSVKSLYLLIRPLGTPAFPWNRDRTGGLDAKGFGVQWACDVEAKDPRLYVEDAVSATLGATGDLANRGTYNSPLTITIVLPASTLTTVRYVGAGTDMTITADGTGAQTLVWDGENQVLKRTVSGVTTVRNDLVTHDAATTFPIVPPGGGSYEVFTTGTVGASTITGTYHEAFI